MTEIPRARLSTLAALFFVALATPAGAQGPSHGIVGWGAHMFDSHWNNETFGHVFAGANSTIALRANGTAVGWGASYWRQCIPPPLPTGVTYADISIAFGTSSMDVDDSHALGLRSDGSLVAWGGNQYGECNVPPLPAGVTYTSASAGNVFSIASKSNGTLAAWGYNGSGQCNPPAPPPGQSFVKVAAGLHHALGLLSNGNIVGWGDPVGGSLAVPPLPSGLTYLELGAGFASSVALRSDGAILRWGINGTSVPALPAGVTYTTVRAGASHVLALRSDGVLVAWGDNTSQQCDIPSLPPGVSYVQIAAGLAHSAALRSDGRVVCWGDNRKFQCNVPRLPPGVSYTKFALSSDDETQLGSRAPESFMLALRSDGVVEVSGNFSPPPAPPVGLSYVDLAAGWRHALALRSDGWIAAWGDNADGECNVPALPPGLRYVAIAASGGDHYDSCGWGQEWTLGRSFALRSDGVLVSFGDSGLGQLNLPTPAPGRHYVEIAAAGAFTLGRLSDGSAAACGISAYLPGLPAGVSWIQFIARGCDYYETDCLGLVWMNPGHALGLQSDGNVQAWGANYSGELNVPALLPGVTYVEVACSPGVSVARRSDGAVVAWGSSLHGAADEPPLRAGEAYTAIGAGIYGCVAAFRVGPPCGALTGWKKPGGLVFFLGLTSAPWLPRRAPARARRSCARTRPPASAPARAGCRGRAPTAGPDRRSPARAAS